MVCSPNPKWRVWTDLWLSIPYPRWYKEYVRIHSKFDDPPNLSEHQFWMLHNLQILQNNKSQVKHLCLLFLSGPARLPVYGSSLLTEYLALRNYWGTSWAPIPNLLLILFLEICWGEKTMISRGYSSPIVQLKDCLEILDQHSVCLTTNLSFMLAIIFMSTCRRKDVDFAGSLNDSAVATKQRCQNSGLETNVHCRTICKT